MNDIKSEVKKIAKTALELIKASNELLTQALHKNQKVIISLKEDSSPVTQLDYEIEALFRKKILQKFPNHRILGEESGESGNEGAKFLWIIDPIDGTKQLIRGINKFATQIAVFYENIPVFGVSSAPFLNETLLAYKNGGAFLNDEKIQVSNIPRLENAFTCHGNIKLFDNKNKLNQLVKISKNSWISRGYGDFWGYHLLARGNIDAMLEADTNIWDIAALSLIVEEAGGKSTDFSGSPISIDSTSILATNSLIHDEILEILKGA